MVYSVNRVTIYTALLYSFPNFELISCSMSSSNCCFLTCIQVSQETGKVVWYSHFFKNFPQLVVIHTVKGFIVGNEADVFLEFSCFLYEPANVDSLISGSSAFLNSAWTSGSSWFTYCWSHVKWAQLFGSFSILWHCFSLGLEWKLFPVLWPLLSFPNLLAYWVQHFHSIIFQDLE